MFAKITPQDEDILAQLLSPSERALFERMPIDAQRHSLNVYLMLEDAGQSDPDLAVAALLHDVGKVAAAESGVRLGLWLRGPLVVAEAISPRTVHRWASPDPSMGWRYAMYVHIHHPEIGAKWAEAAGTSATACWLIAAHQDKVPPQPHGQESNGHADLLSRQGSENLSAMTDDKDLLSLLYALQWADSRN